MRLALLLAAASLTGCAEPAALPADPTATLNPIVFFAGRSHGEAFLHKIIGSNADVRVDSIARSDGRGGLILDQIIREGAKPPRKRTWLMQPAGPNRFTGTLTDAIGPVAVTTSGPRADIRYRMKGGFEVTQQLAVQRDGRTVLNRLTVRKFGIRVARLDETIRKLD